MMPNWYGTEPIKYEWRGPLGGTNPALQGAYL